MMAANFDQKIVISMKSTNMPVSLLHKTKSFMYIHIMVSTMKNQRYMASLGFKDVDHGKKPKAKINHFRKTAFIYHRFVLFNSK